MIEQTINVQPQPPLPFLDTPIPHERAQWRVKWELKKFDGDWTSEEIEQGLAGVAKEIIEGEDNLLMYGGVSCLWECLVGNGTGTAAQTLTYFNNSNAYIGVGDSNTAEVATQTDLQAATNKTRIAMDATYPTHTDGVVSGSATITFRCTAASGVANYVWAEWGIFNGSSGGRMLNRKVQALGTKASGSSWQFTVTVTLT